jgi:hypothetical protein
MYKITYSIPEQDHTYGLITLYTLEYKRKNGIYNISAPRAEGNSEV